MHKSDPFLPYLTVRALGAKHALRLFRDSFDLEQLFELGHQELTRTLGRLPDGLVWPISSVFFEKTRKEWLDTLSAGISPVFYGDKDYPERLKELHDPPVWLFTKGKLVSTGPCIAIVGTRRASSYGLEVANRLAEGLASLGMTIVSGLARGIDGAAHVGSLNANGRTWAVLGSGLDRIYPKEHASLAGKILQMSGALVSEYPLGVSPRKEYFPKRNRLIAALSSGVVVVEAGEKSGALITANLALDLGREVLAVPGSVFSEASKGTHALIREGAQLIRGTHDVIEALGFHETRMMRQEKEEPALFGEVQGNLKSVLAILEPYPQHIESLLLKSGLSVDEVASALTELEFLGLIKSLPGKYYQKF